MTVVETATPYTLKSIVYHVPSASEPGLVHDVTVTDERVTCDCEASKHAKTRGRCWHLQAVKAGLYVGKPHMRIEPLPPAPTPACPHGRTARLCAACVPMPSAADLYA